VGRVDGWSGKMGGFLMGVVVGEGVSGGFFIDRVADFVSAGFRHDLAKVPPIFLSSSVSSFLSFSRFAFAWARFCRARTSLCIRGLLGWGLVSFSRASRSFWSRDAKQCRAQDATRAGISCQWPCRGS